MQVDQTTVHTITLKFNDSELRTFRRMLENPMLSGGGYVNDIGQQIDPTECDSDAKFRRALLDVVKL